MNEQPLVEYRSNYVDVDLRVEAGSWVATDAAEMAVDGWRLVSFAVCQHFAGDGRPLRGAAVFAVYSRGGGR